MEGTENVCLDPRNNFEQVNAFRIRAISFDWATVNEV